MVWLFCACQTTSCGDGGRGGPGQRAPGHLPTRVVSLTPSLTELVFALGKGDRVVGVSDYCQYPDAARHLPKVGSFLAPAVERVLALRPDLVLLDGVQAETAAALHAAGVPVEAVPMQSLADVRAATVRVARVLGDVPAGVALVSALDAQLAAVAQKSAGRPRTQAVFVVDRQIGSLRGVIVAGPGSYLDELLRLAGGDNVYADLKARYGKVSRETIELRRPQVILDAVHVAAESATKVATDWNVLVDVPAVDHARVHVLADPAVVTPGPRLGTVVERLYLLLSEGQGR